MLSLANNSGPDMACQGRSGHLPRKRCMGYDSTSTTNPLGRSTIPVESSNCHHASLSPFQLSSTPDPLVHLCPLPRAARTESGCPAHCSSGTGHTPRTGCRVTPPHAPPPLPARAHTDQVDRVAAVTSLHTELSDHLPQSHRRGRWLLIALPPPKPPHTLRLGAHHPTPPHSLRPACPGEAVWHLS